MDNEWEIFYPRFKVNGVWGALYRHTGGALWKWRGNTFVAENAAEARSYLRDNKIIPKER